MDADKAKKKAVEKLKNVKPRNYWNTSGKDTDSFPSKPRRDSIPKRVVTRRKDAQGNIVKKVRIPQEPKNPWWIDSKQDNYDFWVWLERNSNDDGTMEPMQQAEIGKMFGCSATKVHFIIKQAVQKLINNGYHHVLADFLKAEHTDDPELNIFEYDNDPDYDI